MVYRIKQFPNKGNCLGILCSSLLEPNPKKFIHFQTYIARPRFDNSSQEFTPKRWDTNSLSVKRPKIALLHFYRSV